MPPNQCAVVRGVVVADVDRGGPSSSGTSTFAGGAVTVVGIGGGAGVAVWVTAAVDGVTPAGAFELLSIKLTGAAWGGGVGAALMRLPLFSRRLPLF